MYKMVKFNRKAKLLQIFFPPFNLVIFSFIGEFVFSKLTPAPLKNTTFIKCLFYVHFSHAVVLLIDQLLRTDSFSPTKKKLYIK